jgi:hypothetical protein
MRLPGRIVEPIYQAAQHGNNSDEHRFSLQYSVRRENAFCHQGIETAGTFCSGSASVVKKLSTNLPLAFAIAFGGVKQRGKACAIKLIAYLAGFGAGGLSRFFD